MTTAQQTQPKRKLSPLLVPAALLSLASLAWTTYSLVDLLGTGLIGVTVAAGADVIWASVIVAEARRLRIGRHAWIVPTVGWAALAVVAALLAWHGINKGIPAMAVAGPFLPLGAKVVWVLALADMRDPAELTDDELNQLALMERGMAFEEAKHRIEMRRREMGAELLMAEVSTDFDIALMRQDKTRELGRRQPLELEAGDALRTTYERITPHHDTDAPVAPTASPTLQATVHPAPARTDAVSEVAAHPSDAPQMPTGAVRGAAPQASDAALQLDGLTKAAAVRAVRDALPTASAPQIVQRLAHHGIEATDAYVRTVLSRNKQQRTATDGGYL